MTPMLTETLDAYVDAHATPLEPLLQENYEATYASLRSPERAEFARSYFDRSPWGERIDVRVGPALETVTALDGPFDFVFIDADKDGYPDYYEAVVPKLSAR